MKDFNTFLTELALTLRVNDTLNPKLWDGFTLKPEVRKALLVFAASWQKYAKIPDDCIKDVLFLGGNANYNYTDHSDIDVHLYIDKAALGDSDFIDDYLSNKKTLWTLLHPTIKVRGYQLEPYAQGLDEVSPVGAGVFSLRKNKWIQKPKATGGDWLRKGELNRKVEKYVKAINFALKNDTGLESMKLIKDKIVEGRRAGIKQYGEFAMDNLVFKELRNLGMLSTITTYIRTKEDATLSLE